MAKKDFTDQAAAHILAFTGQKTVPMANKYLAGQIFQIDLTIEMVATAMFNAYEAGKKVAKPATKPKGKTPNESEDSK